MKKLLLGIGLFAASVGLFAEQGYAADDYVYIPNAGIRHDIKAALESQNIFVENELPEKNMLDQFSSIDRENFYGQELRVQADYDSVGSLEGVQYLTNLESVAIFTSSEGNEVIDFRPLKNLKNLKEIHSYVYKDTETKTFLTDISPLENLEKLESIELNGGHFLDLTPLEKSLKAGNLISIQLNSGRSLLNLDSITIPKEQDKYEMVSPVKYPASFKTITGIEYNVTAYYTKEPASNFYEVEEYGIKLTSSLEDGIIKLSDLPVDKSEFSYLFLKVDAYKSDMSKWILFDHSVSLAYPVHFY